MIRTELDFDANPVFEWMASKPMLPVAAIALYVLGILYGQNVYFATREPWNWRTSLALWNFSLSAFSLIGFLRVLPQVAHNFTHYTWKENFCFEPESSYGQGPSGLWVMLFISSKFPELFDTFFIVIHKKPLIFLHWYHHISVLLYCWQAYVSKAPVGVIFCVMNYAVHAFMYFYYYLMAIHKKPKFLNAMYITVAQISQMVVGVAVTLASIYLLFFDKDAMSTEECKLKPVNIVAALIMYGSYLALFLEFFLKRYFSQKVPRQQKLSTKDVSYATTNGHFHKEPVKKSSGKVLSMKED